MSRASARRPQPCDQTAGHRRRNRPVAGDPGRGGIVGEQALVGEHQIDRDRCRDVGRPAGDPFHQGVGHDLAARTAVAAHVGLALQCGVHRYALGHRQQRGHIRHGVRGGPDGDGPFGLRYRRAVHHALEDPTDRRWPWPRRRSGRHRGPPTARAPRTTPHRGAAVGDGQTGRLADHHRGPPFRELALLQRGQRVRHLVDQGLGETQVAIAAGGESRRASATSAANPRPRRGWAASDLLGLRRVAAKAAVARAWAGPAADLSESPARPNTRDSATSSASGSTATSSSNMRSMLCDGYDKPPPADDQPCPIRSSSATLGSFTRGRPCGSPAAARARR